jgi:glycolate dehydrogenase FAD-binding subunit
MTKPLRPETAGELCEVIAAAADDRAKLRLRAGGSKDAIGMPTPGVPILDMRGFRGVVDYDPAELVLTVRPATPLADVEALVTAEDQMLAFDPWDHGRLLGAAQGAATIGGVVAAGVSGPQRVAFGAARDHLLGFEAVSGRGEAFKAGSKVVKNVTGFDLSKLIAGSWGRLVALTQLTLRVVPKPQTRVTLLQRGLDPEAAIAVMARALGSAAGVAATAHLPAWHGGPATLFRLDGFQESVTARADTLRNVIAGTGPLDTLAEDAGATLWNDIRDAAVLPVDRPLWRIVVAPGKAAAVVAALEPAEWIFDWGGGLVWAVTAADADFVRTAAAAAGGHAALIRADAQTRAVIPALHPPSPGVSALEASVRRAFDPAGVFENGRF